MAFSLRQHGENLETCLASGRAILSVARVLQDHAHVNPGSVMILRHDVDRLPARAVAMAAIERQLGIAGTYYFRSSARGLFQADAVARIHSLGHEVGYHYEALSRCRGDFAAAVAAFRRDVSLLRKIAPCQTVAMHGAPFSRHDNQELIGALDVREMGLLGDAVRDLAFLSPVYLTDTGGAWNAPARFNLRDRAGEQMAGMPDPEDRSAFSAFLRALERPIYFNVHPERWPSSRVGVVQAALTDSVVNMLKASTQMLLSKAVGNARPHR